MGDGVENVGYKRVKHLSVLNLTFYKIVLAVGHNKTPTFWTPKFHSDDVNLSIICLGLPFKGLKDQI